jgi:hypothetical protein
MVPQLRGMPPDVRIPDELEVTGHPAATLYLSSTESDGARVVPGEVMKVDLDLLPVMQR